MTEGVSHSGRGRTAAEQACGAGERVPGVSPASAAGLTPGDTAQSYRVHIGPSPTPRGAWALSEGASGSGNEGRAAR